MSMKLYVGNLAFSTSSQDLQELFAAAGTVESASVVEDRDTGRSRGFGFVEMSSKEEGEAAIAQFNGKEVNGHAEEGVAHGEALGSSKHNVLEDVGDAGVVLGHGGEKYGERVVVIGALDVDVPRAGPLVLELVVGAFEALEPLATQDRV